MSSFNTYRKIVALTLAFVTAFTGVAFLILWAFGYQPLSELSLASAIAILIAINVYGGFTSFFIVNGVPSFIKIALEPINTILGAGSSISSVSDSLNRQLVKNALSEIRDALSTDTVRDDVEIRRLFDKVKALEDERRVAVDVREIYNKRRSELESYSRNVIASSHFNIFVGVVLFFAGLFVLWGIASDAFAPDNNDAIFSYVSRAFIGVSVQAAGLFFFRMYAVWESRARYYRDELTNIDFWMMAYASADGIASDNSEKEIDLKRPIIERFSSVDRNSSALSRNEVEPSTNDILNLVEKIQAIISKS